MRQRKDIVVGGLGNLLMTDEGAGLYVVRELRANSGLLSYVEFVELGSSLMGVIHAIANREKAILVDCAYMGEPAGTIRCFSPKDVASTKALAHFSLHEGDLLGALELSQKLGEYPREVVIFGIQPENIGMGDSLSSTLKEQLGSYVKIIMQELKRDHHV